MSNDHRMVDVEFSGHFSCSCKRISFDHCSCLASLEAVGFSGSSAGKELACNAGDPGSIPESGRSTGEGIDYPLRYS